MNLQVMTEFVLQRFHPSSKYYPSMTKRNWQTRCNINKMILHNYISIKDVPRLIHIWNINEHEDTNLVIMKTSNTTLFRGKRASIYLCLKIRVLWTWRDKFNYKRKSNSWEPWDVIKAKLSFVIKWN